MNGLTSPYFISNIDRSDVNSLQRAAKYTNTNIRVGEKAVDLNGKPLKGVVTVYTVDTSQDHSDMWVRFHELIRNKYRVLQ